MYCSIIWHFCSISDKKNIEKMQLKALRHIYKDYTSSYEMLREKCNRPMGHSMSDHPQKMKFETASPQILIKWYTLPLCDYNRRTVIFYFFFE